MGGEHDRRRTNLLVWLVALTITLATGLIAYHAYRLWYESADAEDRIKLIAAAGFPIDNASLERWHRVRNQNTNSALWGDILDLTEHHILYNPDWRRLPFLGDTELPEILDPDQPWDEEPYVAEYLQYAQPILDKLRQVTTKPQPVWLPVEFRGFWTSTETESRFRSVMRLLSLELEHALYHRDAERAMYGLSIMKATCQSYPRPYSLVTDLIKGSCEASYHSAVQRSLQVDLWTEAQLEELTEQLGPAQQVTDHWRAIWAGERALLAASIWAGADTQAGGPSLVKILSTRLKTVYMKASDEILSAGTQDLNQLLANSENLERSLNRKGHHPQSIDDMTAEIFMPAVVSNAQFIASREDSRRQTRVALGIKRYQKRFGQWPQRLKDLSAIGLTSEDWSTVRSGSFGYSAEADQVWLWHNRQGYRHEMVPEARPQVPIDSDEQQPSYGKIRIR